LPEKASVQLRVDEALYAYDDQRFPPGRDTGPAPECRVEVTPDKPAREDWFLHVLTATDATVESVPAAVARIRDDTVEVQLDTISLTFFRDRVGGTLSDGGKTRRVAQGRTEKE
jgi:hypothetical protein